MAAAVAPISNPVQYDNDWRGRCMRKLVDWHYRYYHHFTYRDRKPWAVTIEQLLAMPVRSVGYQLGYFLRQNNFSFIPKFENHDLFHVLLGYGLTVTDEVRMQCCLVGSGRRTFSTWITILIGLVFYPEHWRSFYLAYQRGGGLRNFSYWEFEALLARPLTELQHRISVHSDAVD